MTASDWDRYRHKVLGDLTTQGEEISELRRWRHEMNNKLHSLEEVQELKAFRFETIERFAEQDRSIQQHQHSIASLNEALERLVNIEHEKARTDGQEMKALAIQNAVNETRWKVLGSVLLLLVSVAGLVLGVWGNIDTRADRRTRPTVQQTQ